MIRIFPAMLLAIVCYATAAVAAPTPREILDTYANIAEAMYGDAHSTAKTLRSAVNRLLTRPSPETLAAARDA